MKKIPRRQPLHHSKIISSCRIFEDVPNSVVKWCLGARLSAGGEARRGEAVAPFLACAWEAGDKGVAWWKLYDTDTDTQD
jgi:hypothetical protein